MPDEIKAGLRTALFSFLTLFSISAIQWLNAVQTWVSEGGKDAFPGVSTLGTAVLAGIVGALIGLVTTMVNYLQGRFPGLSKVLGGKPAYQEPPPPPPEPLV